MPHAALAVLAFGRGRHRGRQRRRPGAQPRAGGAGHQQPRHHLPLCGRGRPQRRREPRPARHAGPAWWPPSAATTRASGCSPTRRRPAWTCRHVVRTDEATGSYLAVLDADGELVVAVADMAGTDALLPDDVRRVRAAGGRRRAAGARRQPRPAHPRRRARSSPGHRHPGGARPGQRAQGAPVSRHCSPTAAPLLAVTPNLAELGALTGRTATDDADMPARGRRPALGGVEPRLGAARPATGRSSRPTARPPGWQPCPVRSPTSPGPGTRCWRRSATPCSPGAPAGARRAVGHAAAALTVAVPETVRPT